jgi:putative ABC transport system permease protein
MWNGNLKTAVTNLRLNKWRSILTMMGIIIGVSSVVTVVSLGEGLKHQVVGQINQLGSRVITVRSGRLNDGTSASNLSIFSLWNASTLTDKDTAAIAKLPSVSGVVSFDYVTNSATGDSGELDNISVMGTSTDMASVLNKQVDYGGFFSSDQQNQDVAVIGTNIAQKMFGELNPVGHSLQISGTDFVVGGVLAKSPTSLLSVAETDFNSAVFIPIPVAQSLTGGHSNILQILAKSNDDNVDGAASDIKAALYKTHNGANNFTVLKQDELLSLAGGVINLITEFISGIAAIALVVGGIGIMDIMLASVSERTREIGIRKAVGATNRQIRSQFLAEGLVLSVAGGLIGIVVALAINIGLRIYTNLQPIISVSAAILAASVSLIIGVIFSVVPSVKAARKNPIDALRNE